MNTRARGYEVATARALVSAIALLTAACVTQSLPDTTASAGSSNGGSASSGSSNGVSGSSTLGPIGGGGKSSSASGGTAGAAALGGAGSGGGGAPGGAGVGGAAQAGNGGAGGAAIIPVPGMGVFNQQVIDGLKDAVEHLYTFDGTDAAVIDSKGDADGTILGWDGGAAPASVQSGGDLNFSSNNAYVDFGPGFITAGPGASNAVSIEAFITLSQPVPFARLYDFGTQDKDAQLSPLTYMFMAPSDGAFPKVVSKGANGQEEGMVSQRPLPKDQMVHIVVTYEQKTFVDGDLDAKTEVFLWVNAEPAVAGRWRGVLSELADVNCWINRSQFQDGGLNAKLHEFRVYGATLNQQQVQNSFAAGIDALSP